jgi:hypothetical protein
MVEPENRRSWVPPDRDVSDDHFLREDPGPSLEWLTPQDDERPRYTRRTPTAYPPPRTGDFDPYTRTPPTYAPLPSTPDRRRRRRGLPRGVIIAAVAALAIGIGGIAAVTLRPDSADSVAGPPPATAAPTTAVPTTPPAPVSTLPAGFVTVTGPGDIQVVVPGAWKITKPYKTPYEEAQENGDRGRIVRFGGGPASTADPLALVRFEERTNRQIRDRYHRLRLTTVPGPTGRAVDWEYRFVNTKGQARHAYGRYWYADGRLYLVYVATPESAWSANRELLRVVLNNATS